MQISKDNTPTPGPSLVWGIEYIFSELSKDTLTEPILSPDGIIEIYGVKIEMDEYGDAWVKNHSFETLSELCNHILQFRPSIGNK